MFLRCNDGVEDHGCLVDLIVIGIGEIDSNAVSVGVRVSSGLIGYGLDGRDGKEPVQACLDGRVIWV